MTTQLERKISASACTRSMPGLTTNEINIRTGAGEGTAYLPFRLSWKDQERMTPVGDFSSITDFSFFENNGTAGI